MTHETLEKHLRREYLEASETHTAAYQDLQRETSRCAEMKAAATKAREYYATVLAMLTLGELGFENPATRQGAVAFVADFIDRMLANAEPGAKLSIKDVTLGASQAWSLWCGKCAKYEQQAEIEQQADLRTNSEGENT